MSLKHAILGLLDAAPMTGYDLKKAFDGSVAHFWAADQAQIYRTLAGLTADGLVSVEVVPQSGRPERHEHAITESGRSELSSWLRSDLPPERVRDPFLARVFFAGREDPSVLRGLLTQRRAGAVSARDRLREIRGSASGAPALTLDYGLRAAEAEIAWIDDALAGES